MTLALRYAVRSDRGLVRGNNEDSVYAGPRLLAIADGMGGHAAGEVASKIAVAAVEHLDEDRPVGDLLAALRRAVNDELTARQREVFVAIVLNDVPLDTLVLSLASSRNAIYKMLFDARRKLRAALAANGYLRDEPSRRS